MILPLLRALAGDPVRTVLLAALGLMCVTLISQCRQEQTLRERALEAGAALVACQADERICRAANESLAASVVDQNAAVDAMADDCTTESEDSAKRAVEAIARPRLLSVGNDAAEMNRWLASY